MDLDPFRRNLLIAEEKLKAKAAAPRPTTMKTKKKARRSTTCVRSAFG